MVRSWDCLPDPDFNPELIIIGGQVAEASQFIKAPIQQAIHTYCNRDISNDTEIQFSDSRAKAGTVGVAAYAFRNCQIQNNYTWNINFTGVEKAFFEGTKVKNISTRIPYITVESFPKLGFTFGIKFYRMGSQKSRRCS